ncbi:MAG: DNA polymerase/3'-5' exonuclease PolX [Gemmatimonadota bacterium]|nr:DNA polymerase/3'-5' exonuclease PolX [Gemmatimonadota bacterium]MDH3427021.1 DNA polymerase/3'-5' exonuclease PolX [Gemmatimonadota bacterium]
MENLEIAAVLREMADLLEIKGGVNPFRIRAYRNAVYTVEEYATPLRTLVEEGADLTELPSVGNEMASHIVELVTTGHLSRLVELAAEIPRSLVTLIRLPGVGPKKARKLWDELGITTIDELEAAAAAGQVAELEGFGEKTQGKILEGIVRYRARQGRFRLAEVDELIRPLLDWLRTDDAVQHVEVAGSYRRRRETVGDVDILAISSAKQAVIDRFLAYPQVLRVDLAGETRATVHLASELQVDLRVLDEQDAGAALVYFTGSKEHNIALRRRALERGLSVSEYGVFKLAASDGVEPQEDADLSTTGRELGERVAGRTEQQVYESLGLPWIPPELREQRGEIVAAERNELPQLVSLEDMRGDLQMHSDWSDGKNTIEEMLEACVSRGYEYFALTDHSQALAMTGGMDAEKLARQLAAIDEIASRHPEIRFLRSMEIDVLADGSLDIEDGMLERLDLVVISIHSRFDLSTADQTRRLVRAIEHPASDIVGHPTGRIIGRRDAIEFDLAEVLDCAAENHVAMECNAHPNRLDLRDTHMMEAKKRGVPIVISTDAHRVAELDLMSYGVEQARRAWLTPGDVLNAGPLEVLLSALGRI